MRANARFNQVLHEQVVVVSVRAENVPYVAPEHQIVIEDLGYPDDGIVHLELRFGFQCPASKAGCLEAALSALVAKLRRTCLVMRPGGEDSAERGPAAWGGSAEVGAWFGCCEAEVFGVVDGFVEQAGHVVVI